MYEVFYRLGGHEDEPHGETHEDWRRLEMTAEQNERLARTAAEAVQRVLYQVGYSHAQAEVREVDAPPAEVRHGETQARYTCAECGLPAMFEAPESGRSSGIHVTYCHRHGPKNARLIQR